MFSDKWLFHGCGLAQRQVLNESAFNAYIMQITKENQVSELTDFH